MPEICGRTPTAFRRLIQSAIPRRSTAIDCAALHGQHPQKSDASNVGSALSMARSSGTGGLGRPLQEARRAGSSHALARHNNCILGATTAVHLTLLALAAAAGQATAQRQSVLHSRQHNRRAGTTRRHIAGKAAYCLLRSLAGSASLLPTRLRWRLGRARAAATAAAGKEPAVECAVELGRERDLRARL